MRIDGNFWRALVFEKWKGKGEGKEVNSKEVEEGKMIRWDDAASHLKN